MKSTYDIFSDWRAVRLRWQSAAFLVIAAVTGVASPFAVAQPQSGGATILISNGTKAPLTCRLRTDETGWTEHQTIAPDYALTWPSPSGVRSYMECSPPVSPTVYEIVAGQRYVLMSDKGQSGIALRTVAPPASKK